MPVLDATFNLIAAAFAPAFLVTGTQFADFAAMRDDYRRKGILTVNVDFSDGTIFGCPVTNWQFRAWHDAGHIAMDSDFSAQGERAAAAYQIAQVFTVYGFNEHTKRWAALIDCEVNAQAAHFYRTGEFVQDQFAFTLDTLRKAGIDTTDCVTPAAYRSAREYRAATIAAMPPAQSDPYAHIAPPAHLLDLAGVYVDCMETARTSQAAAAHTRGRRAYR